MLDEGRVAVLEASPEQFLRHGLVGADTAGFGAGTVHRPEVEARCAGCHPGGGLVMTISLTGCGPTRGPSAAGSSWSASS